MDDEVIKRVLKTWASDAASFAEVLARIDQSWRSEHFSLAGGHVVLCGRGMYVNRALAVGFDDGLSESDWERFEQRCNTVGVPPACEVSPATNNAVRLQLASRGYVPSGEQSALLFPLDTTMSFGELDPTLVIEPANGDLLALWQATSAQAWGHVTSERRRASDAFAHAAAIVDGDGLLIVRDADDGRPVGCASMTVSNGIATLGGMSTLPGERGRGVQTAAIRYRLCAAVALGCDLAASTAEPGSISEANLERQGFRRAFSIETHTLHPEPRPPKS